MLRGTDEIIKDRTKLIPREVMAQSHWMPNHMERRLGEYNKNNHISNIRLATEGKAVQPIFIFFQENKTELFEIDCHGENFEMFESMRIYIERYGRPYNYLSSVEELNDKRHEHLTKEE